MTSLGRFISVEGGEGVGKSTQIAALAAVIRQRGHTVVVTREPGGTSGAEAIRQLLLTGADGKWAPRAEALLFAAARSDHVERLIRPALAAGTWVISDRFLDSLARWAHYCISFSSARVLRNTLQSQISLRGMAFVDRYRG